MRPVLLWNSFGADLATRELEALGWRVDLVPRADAEPAAGVRHRVGVAVFDPRAADLAEVQRRIAQSPGAEWIAVVPPGSIVGDEAKRLIVGAFADFHTLPVDPPRLSLSLGHAWGVAQLRASLDAAPSVEAGGIALVGRSPPMQDLQKAVRRIAASGAAVLITGETGTGKELVARTIHALSDRRGAPFNTVDCGALPDTLIQTELFGYEKGAFTDAKARKLGRIEAAAGGTILLDEIGDLPLAVQSTLLRFLQEHTITRVGGRAAIPVAVRVIAATHVDLEQLVAEGKFREDLFFRLNVLRLRTPALRERPGDIELLARWVLDSFGRETNPRVRDFSRLAVERMNSHDWPGNVRELINRVQRAIVMCEGRLITAADLGLERRLPTRNGSSLEDSRDEAERQAVRDALLRHRSVTRASAELGVSRMTLYRLMSKLRLDRRDLLGRSGARNGPSR